MDLGKDPFMEFSQTMKREWDKRAQVNAKWYINLAKVDQSEEEFDATARAEIKNLITPDLQILTQGRDPKNLRLLEIGCGIGRMTRHLAQIFGEVHGVDVSGEMIRQGRERLGALANVRLRETNGVDFSGLPSDYFDLAFSAYVYQHVPDAAVIRTNIIDAYRVLKPGGIFKFQVNSITAPEFAAMEKDTWIGASFSEAEMSSVVQELGAQVIGLVGGGTQYCWTILRKPYQQSAPAVLGFTPPRIIDFGRADDLSVKTIPVRGYQAYLTLIVSGLDRELVGANNLSVEIAGYPLVPCYVGPVRSSHATQLKCGEAFSHVEWTAVSVEIPSKIPSGALSVRLRPSHGNPSNSIEVVFRDEPVIPVIQLISNACDGGMDICAHGPKSLIRLFVMHLDKEMANTTAIRVQINGRLIEPESVEYVPNNNLYLVRAQLPDEIRPGEIEVRLRYGALQSPAQTFRLS